MSPSKSTAGSMANNAIDLTSDHSDDEVQFISARTDLPAPELPSGLPRRPPRMPPKGGKAYQSAVRGNAAQRNGAVASHRGDTDLQVLHSHRDLQVWKNKHFQELGIQPELALVEQILPSALQTIVPDRYLRKAARMNGLSTFPGRIEILGPIMAIKKAFEEHTIKREPSRLVIWTDGAARGSGGIGIAYRQSSPDGTAWEDWSAMAFKAAGTRVDSHRFEVLAIMKAIDIARDRARRQPHRCQSTTIYTDSQSVLRQLQGKPNLPLITDIIKKAAALTQSGSTIMICWCPGHSKVRFFDPICMSYADLIPGSWKRPCRQNGCCGSRA